MRKSRQLSKPKLRARAKEERERTRKKGKKLQSRFECREERKIRFVLFGEATTNLLSSVVENRCAFVSSREKKTLFLRVFSFSVTRDRSNGFENGGNFSA